MAKKRKRKGKAILDAGAAHFIIRANCSCRAHEVRPDKKKEAARKACRRKDWGRG